MTHRLLIGLLALLFACAVTGPVAAAPAPQQALPVPPTAEAPEALDPITDPPLPSSPVPPGPVATPDSQLNAAAAPDALTSIIVTLVAQAASVVVGAEHACALTSDGGVRCWGNNFDGQLGDDTTTTRTTPVEVSGLASGAVAVTAGGYHTCALIGGGVKCWGSNAYGQLGNGTTDSSDVPVDVSGLAGNVIAVAAGGYHTCALLSTGGVKCWGQNATGQLGNDAWVNSLTPVDVSGFGAGLILGSAVTAGEYHTCALTTGGAVQCWGRNSEGQLGNNSDTNSPVPVAVSGLASEAAAVAAGDRHTCARTTTGAVKCWGNNSDGQLGDGTSANSLVPVGVTGLTSDVAAVTAAGHHTCALRDGVDDGTIRCWGSNSYGQLGDGTVMDSAVPVSGLAADVAALAAGGNQTCAVIDGGAIECWGDNTYGQLGDGTLTDRATPVDLSGAASNAVAMAAGKYHTCTVTAIGGVQCWGSNDYGQLGDDTTISRYSPGDVSGVTSGATAVAVGSYHTCAVIGGGVKCWGRNTYGQLGNGTTARSSTPVTALATGSGVSAVTTGEYHTCAMLDAAHGGGVKCWGRNTYGQLGDGTNANNANPVSVSGLSGMTGVAAGGYHACAVTTGGAVRCWGYNALGQLGDGTSADSTTPVNVSGLTEVAHIAAGGSDTCAVTTGGAVKCWGDNAFGQLGDGTLDPHATPAGVTGFDGSEGKRADTLATSGYHACAVTTGGGVRCWGRNSEGQLGNNTFTNHLTPTDVWELDHGMAAVAAGGNHTCAVMDADHSGVSKCWGHNAAGQLGINPGWTPVAVVGFRRAFEYQLGISPAAAGILLTWQHGDPAHTGVTRYEAYRSAEPYVTPGAPEVPPPAFPVSGTTANYADGDAFEPSAPHFYVIQAVISADLKYPESNRVGTFSFVLIPGAP